MTDEMLQIFRQEVGDYLHGLNEGLLKVEMANGDDQTEVLNEMNRLAHSMKGAARAMGVGLVETISHYLEEVFHYTLQQPEHLLPPETADSLYDGLDLIQNYLDGSSNEPETIANVLKQLEEIITGYNSVPVPPAAVKPKKRAPKDKRITQDSDEMPVINLNVPQFTQQEIETHESQVDDILAALERQTKASPKHPAESKPPNRTTESNPPVNDELMSIFRGEMEEYLGSLNEGLLKIETLGSQPNVLREMNRWAHSMKGAARAVGFKSIETLAHSMEEVFQAAQQSQFEITPAAADALYDGLDVIQNILYQVEMDAGLLEQVGATLAGLVTEPQDTSEAPPTLIPLPIPATVETSRKRATEEQPTSKTPAEESPRRASNEMPAVKPTSSGVWKFTTQTEHIASTLDGLGSPLAMRPAEDTLRVSVGKLDELMGETSELLVARLQGDARQRNLTELRRKMARWRREWRSVRTAYIRLARRLQEQEQDNPELTTLFKFLQSNEDYLNETNRELTAIAQTMMQDGLHLATLADTLQDSVSALRMMPFETMVGGFQRMVRDLARDTQKQVQLDIIGSHVEIDKTVLDALKDPVMHLLRNAVDHGIEAPESREAQGKMPAGRIQLSVEQRGTEIVLRVSDDGHGIDAAKVRRKAIAQGILTENQADLLGEEELQQLIFHSGLSTSDQVTAISGRGLGMDIVRDRVESLRGQILVQSKVGQGTTMTLSVPVSLTRIRGILLRVGEEDYAIPSTMVLRMETLPRSAIFTGEGREMVLVNERPMPLVSLGALLEAPGMLMRGEEIHLLALQSADKSVAFEVDMLYSELELVLKPLGPELRNAPYVAGAALLGSGDVVIMLDANDLIRRASGATLLRRSTPSRKRGAVRKLRVLVVDDSITTRTLEKNILEAIGFDVLVAIDGMEAWQILGDTVPDVIISDVEMPNMNGLELTRRVKNSEHTRHIPLILLTSLAKPEQREAGLQAGADAYLVKSRFDQAELLETIQAVI